MQHKIWLNETQPPPDDSWSWCRTYTQAFEEIQSFSSVHLALAGDEVSREVADSVVTLAFFNAVSSLEWEVAATDSVVRTIMEKADLYWRKHQNKEYRDGR